MRDRFRFRFCGSGGSHRVPQGRGNIIRDSRSFHLHQFDIVKVSLADTFGTVAAQPNAQRDFFLIRPGFAVPLQILPLTICIVKPGRRSIQILDAKIRSVALVPHAFYQHIAGKTVIAIGLYPHGGDVSCVVQTGILNQSAVAAAVCLFIGDLQPGISRLVTVGIGIPPLWIPQFVQLLKSSVGQQIFFCDSPKGSQSHQQKKQQCQRFFHSLPSSKNLRIKLCRCSGVGPKRRNASICSAVPYPIL